jgi:hypothetical protein
VTETEKPRITYRQLREAVDMSVKGSLPAMKNTAAVAALKKLGLITYELTAGERHGDPALYKIRLTEFARTLLTQEGR